MPQRDTIESAQPETVLKDVYRQSIFLEMQQEDAAQKSLGREIFYAIDSNITGLMCDPNRYALSDTIHQRVGVGEIFQHDSEERKQDISASLANYLSYELNRDVPFIVFPPIDDEIRLQLRYYQRNFQDKRFSAQSDKESDFRIAATNISEAGINLGPAELHRLREAFLADPNASEVLNRFVRLMRSGRFLRADIAARSPVLPQEVRGALEVGRDSIAILNVGYRKNRWLKAFEGMGRAPSARAEHDAEALARLCLANARLSQLGSRYAVAYLTLDSSILTAAHHYSDNDFSSATDFVRHPRSFLGEPGVLRPTRKAADSANELSPSLWGLFYVLIGGFRGNSHKLEWPGADIRFTPQQKSSINDFLRRSPSVIPDLLDRWDDFEAAISAEPPAAALERLRKLLAKADLSYDKDAIERCLNDIRDEQSKAWDAFWETNIGARFMLQSAAESAGDRGSPSRDVPLLCFEARPVLQDFLQQSKRWMADPSRLDFAAYERLRQAVLDEDPSGYGDTLAHSFLLALHMQWRSAAILAGRAKEIAADHRSMRAGGSNGREAFYFEALCRRHANASSQILDDLRVDVLRAKAIAEEESLRHQRDFPELSLSHPHDVIPLRFDAELMAIEISRTLFEWEAGGGQETKLAKLGDYVPELERLLEAGRHSWRELRDAPADLPDEPDYLLPHQQRMSILDQTIIRIARNIVAISLQVPSRQDAGRRAWSTLVVEERNRMSANDVEYLDLIRIRSLFMRVVGTCARYLFETPEVDVRRQLERLRVEIQRAKPDRYTFSYDKARYLNMIERTLGASAAL